MIIKNKRIEFFAHNNPQWEQGDELACIAKMTLSMPFYYQYKILRKQFLKLERKLPSKLRRAESL